jgi:hypothetical protein
MAHFAELDENNIVKRVIVIDNSVLLNDNSEEEEQLGIKFLHNLYGENTRWKQTSYNDNFRGKYAYIGCLYYADFDVFTEVRPYNSWTFDEESLTWIPPIPKPDPTENVDYVWNEENLTWDEIPS